MGSVNVQPHPHFIDREAGKVCCPRMVSAALGPGATTPLLSQWGPGRGCPGMRRALGVHGCHLAVTFQHVSSVEQLPELSAPRPPSTRVSGLQLVAVSPGAVPPGPH